MKIRRYDKEARKDRVLQKKFGLTLEQYNEQLEQQNGVCHICGEKETRMLKKDGTPYDLAVDHCHTTLANRGLLCKRCNTTLGVMEDSVELLLSAANYLIRSKSMANQMPRDESLVSHEGYGRYTGEGKGSNMKDPETNHKTDHTLYWFIHKDGTEVVCKRYELVRDYDNIVSRGVSSIVQGDSKSHKGWSIKGVNG